MKTIDSLIREFKNEAQTTRKHFERLPADKLDWRPHEKSFTAGGLASHIVECIGWVDSIFNLDEFVFDPATYKPYQATSAAELLKTFDDTVARGKQVLEAVDEETIMQPWRLKMMDQVLFEKPRADVFRDFTLSHIIHHRGQFSVYLRLLNVPVPGSYGPSADEQAPDKP
ncbi:MAG: DinB family protein [Acidobacteriota bacterium]|nr:DinB family protein [Acidobacteriota bacterium]